MLVTSVQQVIRGRHLCKTLYQRWIRMWFYPANGMNRWFSGLHAVKDVSIGLRRGEILGLVGMGLVHVMEGRRIFGHLTPDDNLVAAYKTGGSRTRMNGSSDVLKANPDVQEFYLGDSGKVDYHNVKHYRRRKRWLA